MFTDAVDDARLIDDIIAGFDPLDAYSKPLIDRTIPHNRIGVPRRDQRMWFGDSESEYLYDRAIETLSSMAQIVEVDLTPLQETARLLYSGPWVAERPEQQSGVLHEFREPARYGRSRGARRCPFQWHRLWHYAHRSS